jgi:hypothetical protein
MENNYSCALNGSNLTTAAATMAAILFECNAKI